ncbi:MAG: T9SS type A sorting domain-containing protein [Candidatus Eisenbacteria bacterium]
MQRFPTRCRSSFPLRAALVALALVCLPGLALAQANGKLQIHHVNVGQGDGILLISPLGQTALFDDGQYLNCTGIKTYLQGLGITVVDYHFASHYHADHVGCIDDLAAVGITIGTAGYDRGYSYSSATYTNYVNTLGAKRQTIAKDQVITLDAGAANPVLLKCVNLNGAGVYSPTGSDENAKSVVMLVSYGSFNEVIAGDLTGSGTTDVETTIGPQVGDVEVYKVHHHGSTYSTNDNWLAATTPEVGIIQVGDGNSYGHPTAGALTRLHNRGVSTYWTETGAGVAPNPAWDTVANGVVLVQADPGPGAAYTVSGSGFSHTWFNNGGVPPINATEVAEGITLTKGSITVGDYTRLAADDALRVSISAGVSGNKYLTDWYGTVTLDHPPLDLAITYDGNYTVSRTQTLWLWNWTTSAWVQVDQTTVSTTDVTRTWSTSSPAAYVSPAREVRLRVSTNSRNSSFTCRGDYMAFNYDYTSGTMRVPAPTLYASAMTAIGAAGPAALAHDARLAAAGEERPLSVLRSVDAVPTMAGADLRWTISTVDHADGFNVYRSGAGGQLEFAGNETSLSVAGEEATFRFLDRSFAGGTTYWLGVRGCSGPEALIGPLVVGPRLAGGTGLAAVAFAAAPNPASTFATLSFTAPGPTRARVDVFDAAGRRVATPLDGDIVAGLQQVRWDLTGPAGRVAPGVYFARLVTGGRTWMTRLLILGL